MPIDPNRESWKPGMSWEQAIADIDYIRGLAEEMGGAERIDRQHAGGRSTVRERIAASSTPAASSRPARWSARPTTTRTATSGASLRVPT